MERQVSIAAGAGGGSRLAPFGLLGDERLARLAAAGHARAFGVVYERYHQALYRYCRSILRNDADAQDALQSTFAAAFAALGRGQRDAPIRPWLFRIAHNESVSVLRRRRPTTDLSAASDRCTSSVEDQVAERTDLGVLLDDLRELNERQRAALVMRELSGLSHEEIATALDTSVGAAKQTIYEARRSLFEFVEGRAMPCDEIRRAISDADGRLLRSRRVRAHLRDCSGCAAFATAIPGRSRELRALVPTMPGVAAAGLLERVAGAGAGHGSAGGLSWLAGGATGKAAGTALAANALAGVAVVASATVGVAVGVDKLAHASRPGARQSVVPTAATIPHRAPAVVPAGAAGALLRQTARQIVPPAATRAHVHGSAYAGLRRHSSSSAPPRPTRRAAPGAASGTRTRAWSGQSGAGVAGPGRSSSAPGHSSSRSTASGRSASAPGHSTTSTGSGRSAAAPGHATTSTGPGHSSAAPGHSSSAGSDAGHSSAQGTGAGSGGPPPSPAPPTPSPPVATTPAPLSVGPPADPPGAAISASHKKH